MLAMLKKISRFFLELIFPDYCFACKKPGKIICDNCLRSIKLLNKQFCPLCEKRQTIQGKICPLCSKQKDFPLDNLIVAANYRDKKLAHAIHLFKYQFISELATPLGKLMANNLSKNKLVDFDFIIPVPLYAKRLRWRGFNQSQLLANVIRRQLNTKPLVLDDLILRHRQTSPQMKIKNHSLRLINVQNAFVLNRHYFAKKALLKNKRFLLVDDVCATGATLVNCAKTLKLLKPKKISAIVLGR